MHMLFVVAIGAGFIGRCDDSKRGSFMNVVSLVGSGIDAGLANGVDLSMRTVVAINNAWRAVHKIDYHVYAGDWLRDLPAYPLKNTGKLTLVSFREYDSPRQHERFGGRTIGLGATMFFNAAYWILGELQPDLIEFFGCSMHYPRGEANTFYGAGNADPLRYDTDDIMRWFAIFAEHAEKRRCRLWNRGTADGLMPYPTSI